MNNITNDFWDVLLWTFWFFIWVGAIMVWFRCVFDMFSDRTLSGLGKAGWALVLVFLPWVGALVYLIVRGKSMSERQLAAMTEQRAAQEKYIQQVAGKPADPIEQIASAKALLDSGAIDQAEFESLKVKALA